MAPGKEVRGVLSRKVSLFSDPGVCGSGVGGCWVLVKELELNLKLPEYGNPITYYSIIEPYYRSLIHSFKDPFKGNPVRIIKAPIF